jgi:hypothetical protein
MDTYLAHLAGVRTAIQGRDYKLERSARAEDEFYARCDQDAWFYHLVSGAHFAVAQALTGLVAHWRTARNALSSPRRLAPRGSGK